MFLLSSNSEALAQVQKKRTRRIEQSFKEIWLNKFPQLQLANKKATLKLENREILFVQNKNKSQYLPLENL